MNAEARATEYDIDERRPTPGWLPDAARNYVAHTEQGLTIRAIARDEGISPSTVLRRIRRIEQLRDDPLIEAVLARGMTFPLTRPSPDPDAAREAAPVLRRLADGPTFLAVASDLDRAVILRDAGPGEAPLRLGTVSRDRAEAWALEGWIAADAPSGRVVRYRLTPSGRALIRAHRLPERALVPVAQAPAFGFGEAPARFLMDEESDGRIRHMRSAMVESPVQMLARRRAGEGAPFLSRAQVAAADRLREEFEAAEIDGPLDWDPVLSGVEAPDDLPDAARPVWAALLALGPGLADVTLRCACQIEGLETFERKMGWSARSGKIVLRIALERLARHYAGPA